MEENKNRRPRPRRNIEDLRASSEPMVLPQSMDVPDLPRSEYALTDKPVSQSGSDARNVSRPAPARDIPKPTDVKNTAPSSVKKVPTEPQTENRQPVPVKKPSVQTPAASQSAAKPQTPAELQSGVKHQMNASVVDITTVDQSFADDNEKTRLTDVQPKAKFKTPVREKVEKPKEKGSAIGGILKALIYISAVILVSVVSAYFVIQFANDVFAFVKSDAAVEVVIPNDASVSDVANILGKSEVIKYPFLFKIYASLMDEDGVDEDGNSVFIPGTYEVSPMKNYMQLLAYFQAQAKPREVVWVTFPEGSTIEEMITVLVDEYGIASREEFKSAINDYDYGLDFLEGVDSLDGRYYRLEGYLFPDTYQFYSDSTAETVVYKMLVNFGDKLDYLSYGDTTYKDRLSELGMTLDEVVTLASIIEEEVKYPIDYDQVSSVFHNRLADPVHFALLGSDATTVYAITMETGERPKELGAAELAFDSPYNTRKSAGLTPGAIANPGFEALYSAFYPAETKYYYFVADSNGYNLYARTEAAHERNKASIKD